MKPPRRAGQILIVGRSVFVAVRSDNRLGWHKLPQESPKALSALAAHDARAVVVSFRLHQAELDILDAAVKRFGSRTAAIRAAITKLARSRV